MSALAACDRSPAAPEPVPAKPVEPAPAADPAGDQVKQVVADIGRVSETDRDLPGVRSLASLSPTLLAGMTPDDERLLNAALFLDARDRLKGAAKPLDRAGVRTVLSGPLDMSRFERRVLDRTLAEAKARAQTDRDYAAAVRLVFYDPFGPNCFFHGRSVCSLAGIAGVEVIRRWIDLQPI